MEKRDSYLMVKLSKEAKRELKQTALDQDTTMSAIVRDRLRNI